MENASKVGFTPAKDDAIIAPNNIVFATVALCDDLLLGSVLSKPGISMTSSSCAKDTRVAIDAVSSPASLGGTGSVFSFLILLARQVLSLTKLNRFDVQNTSLAFVPNLQVNVNKVSDAFKQNFNTF